MEIRPDITGVKYEPISVEPLVVAVAANEPSARLVMLELLRDEPGLEVVDLEHGQAVLDIVTMHYESQTGCPDIVFLDARIVTGVNVQATLAYGYEGVSVVVCPVPAGAVQADLEILRKQIQAAVVDARRA